MSDNPWRMMLEMVRREKKWLAERIIELDEREKILSGWVSDDPNPPADQDNRRNHGS